MWPAQTLNIFFHCVRFWGILPPKTHKMLNKLKNILLLLIILIIFSLRLLEKMINLPTMNTVHIYVDLLKFTMGLLTVVCNQLQLLRRNPWNMILHIIDKIQQKYVLSMIYAILCHVIVIVYLICSQGNGGMSFIGFFFENLSAVSLYVLTFAVEKNLKEMQVTLKGLKGQVSSMAFIKKAKRLYLNSVFMTDALNDFFGMRILLSYGNFGVRLLWALVGFMQVWNPQKFQNEYKIDWNIFGADLFFGFMGIIPPCMITSAATALLQRHEVLITYCYHLQDQFPHNSYEQKELKMLFKYITSNPLELSAQNFFKIHPTVLLGIVAAATTYFIAIIQF